MNNLDAVIDARFDHRGLFDEARSEGAGTVASQ